MILSIIRRRAQMPVGQNILVFIFAGQSNAIDTYSNFSSSYYRDNVYFKSYLSAPTEFKLLENQRYINYAALKFLTLIADAYPDYTIYGMSYARGGTYLRQSVDYPNFSANEREDLYDLNFWDGSGTPVLEQGIKYIRGIHGNDIKVNAMLWTQGEADCQTADASSHYYSEMVALFNKVKSDFSSPNMKLIGLKTNANIGLTYLNQVRQAQDDLVTNFPTSIGYVTADEILLSSENLHYTNDEKLIIGERYADKYLNW